MDLLEELKKRTEPKTPSEAASQIWDFSNDEKETVAPNGLQNPTPEASTQPTTTTPGATNPEAPKIDKKEAKIAAEASQAGIEFLTTLIGEFIVNYQFSKNFTDEQKELLNEKLLDSNPDFLNDEEKTLLARYKRLEKKKDKKLKGLEQGEKARERMVHAFEKYSELTGTTFMTPGLMLGVAVGENVVKTITTLIFD